MNWSEIVALHGTAAEELLAAAKAGQITYPLPFEGNAQECTDRYRRWFWVYNPGPNIEGPFFYDEYKCDGEPDGDEPAIFTEEIEFD